MGIWCPFKVVLLALLSLWNNIVNNHNYLTLLYLYRAEDIKKSKSGEPIGAKSGTATSTAVLTNNISKIRLGSVSPKSHRKREARKGELTSQEIETLLYVFFHPKLSLLISFNFVINRNYLIFKDIEQDTPYIFFVFYMDILYGFLF